MKNLRLKILVLAWVGMMGTGLFCPDTLYARRVKDASGINFITVDEARKVILSQIQQLKSLVARVRGIIGETESLIRQGATQNDVNLKLSELNQVNEELAHIIEEFRIVRVLFNSSETGDCYKIEDFLRSVAERFSCDKGLLVVWDEGGMFFYPRGFSDQEVKKMAVCSRVVLDGFSQGRELSEYGIGSFIKSDEKRGEDFYLQIIGIRSDELTQSRGGFTSSEQESFKDILNQDSLDALMVVISSVVKERKIFSLMLQGYDHGVGFSGFTLGESQFFETKYPSAVSELLEALEIQRRRADDLKSTAEIFEVIFSRSLQVEDFDMVKAVNEAISGHIDEAEAKGLRIDFKSSEDSMILKGLPSLCMLVIDELLRNAIKYTLQGGISIDLRSIKGFFELSVSDTGIGIPEDELSVIRRFGRRGSNVGGIEGLGEGLSIISTVMQYMYGAMVIESEVGKGTKVTVRIPNR